MIAATQQDLVHLFAMVHADTAFRAAEPGDESLQIGVD
jgi:hypothetical protein